jgi:hypothetical protein
MLKMRGKKSQTSCKEVTESGLNIKILVVRYYPTQTGDMEVSTGP